MKRYWILGCAVALTASASFADPTNKDWVDPNLDVNGQPSNNAAGYTQLVRPMGAMNGDCFYFVLDSGANSDNNGGSASHFDIVGSTPVHPEDGSLGVSGQAWLRWDGLQRRLKVEADAAFGTNNWTIRKIWIVVDQASFGGGTGAGLVSYAEVSGLDVKGGSADWGNQTTMPTEPGGNATTQLPTGYHGFGLGPTAGGLLHEIYQVLDTTGGSPQAFQTSSLAFRQFTVGMDSSILPIRDSFALYLAPIDDTPTGQGRNVSLGYDGFVAGSFGFSPTLLLQICVQPATTNVNFPIASDYAQEAPFSAVAGVTCDATLTATDADLGDTLTWSLGSPGSLGGTLVALGPPTNDGMGLRSQNVRYTVPANVRGVDTFNVSVSDGQFSAPTTARFVIRGNAVRNSVAFGAGNGNQFDTMRIYTGSPVAGGGTNGRLDILMGQEFSQSAEFDNFNNLRHNAAGNLLSLNFGPSGGAGSLNVYATQAGCTAPGGNTRAGSSLFTFNPASGLTRNFRVSSLSVSPNNQKLAIEGVTSVAPNSASLIIMNYATGADVGRGGSGAATVSLNNEINMLSNFVWYENRNFGTTWLDNNTVLTVDPSGSLFTINATTGAATMLTAAPYSVAAISVADIEYNPEISPNIYVSIGEFDTTGMVTTNRLYVYDPVGNAIVPQANGQMYTDYSNAMLGARDETFREIGFDCFGNLFIGTFVDTLAADNRRINIKYLPNAVQVANIQGGAASLVDWRRTASENSSNFSGLDVAAGTTIGAAAMVCGTTVPTASAVSRISPAGATCTLTLSATNPEQAESVTFSVTNPGSAGGTLMPQGAVVQNGTTYTQTALYTPAVNFRGRETFAYRANDGFSNSADATVTVDSRGNVVQNTVAFGGSLTAENLTLRLYYGNHVLNGGTAGAQDFLTGQASIQSVEFDNYNGLSHNPQGNLLALVFGPNAATGGTLVVYATQADCGGIGGTVIASFNGTQIAPASRVTGLSVSPNNSKLAVLGNDARRMYVLNYMVGANVGHGGAGAASVSVANVIDISGTISGAGCTATQNRTLSTSWLDNNTILWVAPNGNLVTIDATTGVVTPRVTAPNTPAITCATMSTADVEYNPNVSSLVFVTIGEFVGGAARNSLYVVNPATWTVVAQGPGNFTNHGNGTQYTFRESALDAQGNLLISNFSNATNLTNIKFIPNVYIPSGITNNATVDFSTVPASPAPSSFTGLDVALGRVVAPCALPGDLNGDGRRDGDDVQIFTNCFFAAAGGPPDVGCSCADVAVPTGMLTDPDITGFVNLLVN